MKYACVDCKHLYSSLMGFLFCFVLFFVCLFGFCFVFVLVFWGFFFGGSVCIDFFPQSVGLVY